MSRPIAIVDPYSGGADLAPAFRQRGRPSIMVQSTAEIPPQFRRKVRSSDYLEVLVAAGRESATVQRLRDLGVEFVLAGCDLGVEPAARWSEELGLVGNGARWATAHRDKFTMTELVHEAGLATARQSRHALVEPALEWVRDQGRWPVVLKPLASTSSDGVGACSSESEVRRAFARIAGGRNVLGDVNHEVLLQEYLEGTEYVVDTVSWEGRHRLAAIWRYLRTTRQAPGAPALGYDAMRLEEGEGPTADLLFDYARRVLDSLGVRYGPAHCEVMLVDARPVFVELGARPTAAINVWLNRLCSGVCQLDLVVEAYTEPRSFLAAVDRRYRLERHATNVFLHPPEGRVLRSAPPVHELEDLPSCHSLSVRLEPGEPLPRIGGIVTLVATDAESTERDLRRIRELEAGDFYDVVRP